MTSPHARAFRDFRIKSENNQGEASVLRQQIAANDLVGRHALDKLMVGGSFWQMVGEQRRRNSAAFRGLTRGKNRDDPARALKQLQVRHEITQLFEVLAREQILSFDDDEHVEFARGKASCHLFVLSKLRRVRTKQLASQLSTLSRMTPNAAAIINTIAAKAITQGCDKEIRPTRSTPSASAKSFFAYSRAPRPPGDRVQ